jgi:hypothetical protein
MASRSRWIERHPECRREIIAPPAGKDSEGGVAPCQSVHTLMHGTVTTAYKNSLGTPSGSIARAPLDFSAGRGHDDFELVPQFANHARCRE